MYLAGIVRRTTPQKYVVRDMLSYTGLLHDTLPNFGIDVLHTCPRTPAWFGLGLDLGLARVKLSPFDKFDKLKSGVIALGWIIIISCS